MNIIVTSSLHLLWNHYLGAVHVVGYRRTVNILILHNYLYVNKINVELCHYRSFSQLRHIFFSLLTDIFHCLQNHPEDVEIEFDSYIHDTQHDFHCTRCNTPRFIGTINTMREMLRIERLSASSERNERLSTSSEIRKTLKNERLSNLNSLCL